MIKVLLFDLNGTLIQIVSPNQIKTIPGVKKTLAGLSPKFLCCVATNAKNSGKEIDWILSQGEIKSYIGKIFTPDQLKAKKPSLDYYRKIIRQLQVEPHECAMIGNSLKNDVLPAVKTGMKGIWYRDKAPGIRYNHEKKYWVIPRMEALQKVLPYLV